MTYVYRLDVTYPEGSHDDDWAPEGWEPEPVMEAETGAWYEPPFRWPAVGRLYLSRSAASRRADLLRSYGARVEVVRSEPVRWPS
jgi:hypothetical protein